MPSPTFSPDALILAAGAPPETERERRWLESGLPVICSDGAAAFYTARYGAPQQIVGDGDSLSPALKAQYAQRLTLQSEQETNDLTKAVHYAATQGMHHLLVLGATGLREDHTVGNIALLMEYLREGICVQMLTPHGRFIPFRHKATLQVREGVQISIFNFTCTKLAGKNLRYPLRAFTSWWQGTLNEATATEVEISGDGDFLLFLEEP